MDILTRLQVQYFFAFKSIIAPICFLAIFGDTLHKAGGTIYHSEIITQGTTAHGSVLAWAFFSSAYIFNLIKMTVY